MGVKSRIGARGVEFPSVGSVLIEDGQVVRRDVGQE
jgi:hypothetical protein